LRASLDRDLEGHGDEELEAHLALCRRCCEKAEFTALLRELLSTTPAPTLPDEVGDSLLAFLDDLVGDPPEGISR
jgi:anti-sigma factor ChrR (cupin superfamily)